ncbi:hypothetical protein CERSUDRAFT_127154 [Gelatoporia subvermispora B]|uniref:Hydrophobin n=1 Tax=Ceriporiopsis subvermispora (strain B) TaxID=914234 RepID=M2P8P3_CERS8|nr:hypothetical protein CERSUDRAFT_127154 [Gelatoporia subvermispora B]
MACTSFCFFLLAVLPVFVHAALVRDGKCHLLSCETQVSITEAVRVGEHIINVTAPACTGYIPSLEPVHITESILARRSPGVLDRRDPRADGLHARQGSSSECIGSAICECGTPCAIECGGFTNSDPNPTVSDCDTLVTVLRSFPDLLGPTFVQGTSFPNPILISFSTCAAAFGNKRTDDLDIEYCWDGLALLSNELVAECVSPEISPQGAQCNSDNGAWGMSIGGVLR